MKKTKRISKEQPIFRPKLLDSFKDYSGKKFVSDLIAGLIVAIIALPLSIALAIASGVEDPTVGIYTAVIAGFVISLLGGSRVNISGPTAAFATIVAGIIASNGMEGLMIATIMAGIILILMGIFKFGSLIKYIPYTITTGFTAGIALTIAIGQMKDFLGLSFAPGTNAVETTEKLEAIFKNITTVNWQALLVGGISLLVLIVWPKINKKIPGSLIAVVVGVLISTSLDHIEKYNVIEGFRFSVNAIGDLYHIEGGLPSFALDFSKINWSSIPSLVPSAFTIAILAGIESLLSCVVSDGMIGDKHNSNTELIAQGIGNVCAALFGGIPATGAIARTAANVKNGGKTPIAGIVHALVLFVVLLLLMPYAGLIPMPTIAAILIMVAYNMCEWRQFRQICKTAPKSDILVLVATFTLTVVFDLVVAIAAGLVLAAVLFLKRMSDTAVVRPWSAADEKGESAGGKLKNIPADTDVYDLSGPMFFADSDKFSAIPVRNGCKVLILRMSGVPALDATAARGLHTVEHFCRENGTVLLFSHVNDQPLSVMKKDGLYELVGSERFLPNIDAALAKAAEICEKE